MANRDFKYFYEDEVFRVTKKGSLQFGMVIENAEFHSSDESSDEEEDQVKAGQVRVAWYPSGTEEVVTERRIHLADRSLMPGDVVKRLVQGKSTQRGYCRDVTVYSSIQVIGTSQVIFGVKSGLLTPLEAFKSDILICLDSWVGMVRNVKSRLTVRFNDGSKVVIDDDVAEELDDIRDKRDPECEFKRYDFYPGQILFGPVRLMESGQWLECSNEITTARKQKPHKAFKVTVEEIDFKSLGVSWICRAYFSSNTTPGEESKSAQPKYKVEGEHLKRVRMLNVFEPCTLQIGDRNFYTLCEDDVVMMKSEWKKLQKGQLLKGCKKEDSKKSSKMTSNDVEDAGDDNSSDFEDCDESDAASVSSVDSPSVNIEAGEKSGGSGQIKKKGKVQTGLMTKVLKKKKLKKTKKSGNASILIVKPGDRVVTETLSTWSEVEVVWQDGTVERNIPSIELYPIHHLDDHEFFPGDFITEAKDGFHPHSYGVVQDVDHADRCCKVKWFRTYTDGAQPQPIYVSTSDASVYDLKDHPDFKYRPGSIVIRVMNKAGDDCGLGAGQVLDNQPSGQVSVWWAGKAGGEGVKSSCWPQDLYKVGEYDSDDGELWEDEEEDEASGNDSWETESEEEVDENVKEEDLYNDAQDLKPKLAANIEKARVAMTRLEEIFSENENLQTQDVMKQLLDVYKDCKYLDKLMGTFYFDESNFAGLLDRIRDQDRITTMEAAVKDHVNRLFSVEDEDASPGKDSGHGSTNSSTDKVETRETDSVLETDPVPDSKVCGKLCTMIKCQLIKSHEEVVRRFGHLGTSPPALPDTEPPTEDMEDQETINALVARGLAELEFPSGGSNIFTKTWSSPTDADKVDAPPREEGTTSSLTTNVSTDMVSCPGGSHNVEELKSPTTPGGPVDLASVLSPGSFQMVESVPVTHKFKLTIFQPNNMKNFMKHVKKEMRLLQTSLPPGIIVKGYEERMDLFSVMIHGPKNTPYEDGLFFFDFQLPANYPYEPPAAHYISYCSDRLNPNLYEDGKVCVSLLGTWQGKGTETWTQDSNLLQLLVSIQGLILVREPYFNEAGYEKQRGAQQGNENSRMYNEMAVLKLVQSMTKLARNPQVPFQEEIQQHFQENGKKLTSRLLRWKAVSLEHMESLASTPTTPGTSTKASQGLDMPDFPLVPASKGFCLTLDKAIQNFQSALEAIVVSKMELSLD